MKKHNILAIFASLVLAVPMSLTTDSTAICNAVTDIPDPNGDGVINIADVAYMTLCLNGAISVSNLHSLDINDNDIVSQVDLETLKQYLLNN